MGATEFHVGILGALPTLMLFGQFLAAVLVNHLAYRRWTWFTTALIHRLLLIPIALGPWFLPDVPGTLWVWSLIVATAVNQGLLHFSSPLWLSWMGDYLPHDGLSRFWGERQNWMQWSSAASLAFAAILLAFGHLSPLGDFTVQILVGSVLGIADLMFFFRIEEPPVAKAKSPRWRDVFAEPFRRKEFRRYISFTCFWHFAAMAGAPFISMYLMQDVGMDLFQVLLLWSASWVGGALCSQHMGRWADRYGSRPVLILCISGKSLNMIALLLVPAEPALAFVILVPVFMIDQMLNSGILIANNGFMIKNSPSENRTMYIAACQALAGLVGGVTSIAAGALLASLAEARWTLLGKAWGHFHVMFAVSAVLRWIAAAWVHRLREPNAQSTMHIVDEILSGPIGRFLASPAGAFLALGAEEEAADVPAALVATESPSLGESEDNPPSMPVVPPPKHVEHRARKAASARR
jgi:MFS family permease